MRFSPVFFATVCLVSMASAQPCAEAQQSQAAPGTALLALKRMSAAERENSSISVELESNDSDAVLLGHDVERLWNCGRHDEALQRLSDLQARVGCVAVGNSWRTPVPTIETALWGRDVRVGNRDSLAELSFATQTSGGNLFVALRHGSGLIHWSVCMSADGGATWNETFTWTGSPPTSLDAAVASRHFYVAYNSPGENPQQVRLRRFLCGTGRPDGPWVVPCTLDVGDTMREVSIVTNPNTDQLHAVTLVSDGSMLVSLADADDMFWARLPTGISSGARGGLDATDDGHSDTSCIFFSYFDMSDSLRVYGSSGQRLVLRAGRGGSTSISAFCGTIVCAFEDETTSPYQVRCVSSLGDTAWRLVALSDVDTPADVPAVTIGDDRLAVVFRQCDTTAELRFRQATDGESWSDPVSIVDNPPHSSRPGIEYLGAGIYGVAYLSDTIPVVRGAFFDRSDWVYAIAEQRRLQVDEGILSVTPNPLNSQGRLDYTLSRPADVRLQMYDRAGCLVRTFCEGHRPAGTQAVGFDVTGMVPGVYFWRLDTPGFQAVKKAVVAR